MTPDEHAALNATRQDVADIKSAIESRVGDVGTTEGLTWRTAHERELLLLRRIEARIIADQATPAQVDVNIDGAELAAAVADELVTRLPAPVAQALAANLTARLAK